MKRTTKAFRAMAVTAGVLGLLAAGGCRNNEKYRSSPEFHVEAIHVAIDRVVKQFDGSNTVDPEYKGIAVRGLSQALGSLPDRLEKQQVPDLQRRRELAMKAIEFYQAKIITPLRSPQTNNADLIANLRQLGKMVDEVVKGL